MARNFDLTALRSFVMVADAGGVTRAAGQLNLTQSAVSMQLKRLEDSLGRPLLDRSGRGIALTAEGEQLLGYGRRMLALNDEAWGRMTNQAFEGEINFGVPHDVIYPHVPRVVQRFAAEYPRVRVRLHSHYTADLKEMLPRGEMDLIMTTETEVGPGGETLKREPLVWAGAQGGQIWRLRPVRFASVTRCMFKRTAIEAMEAVGMPWELVVDSVSFSAVEASVAADLGIFVHLRGSVPAICEEIRHGGALPDLPDYLVNMYLGGTGRRAELAARLAAEVRAAYCCPEPERIAAE
jgi:DNA-binding transcriptional LysR family regulator